MSTHKHIDRICVVITLLALLITGLFMNGEALGLSAAERTMGYEKTLFDTSRVHTIDIVIDDWDAFIQTATSEEYAACSVVIDNEAVKNVAIRGKGNTSLSSVASMGGCLVSLLLSFWLSPQLVSWIQSNPDLIRNLCDSPPQQRRPEQNPA